jgi:hypothetical protein
MKGVNAERNPDEPLPAVSEERMSEDKVIEKIELLRSCAGVYAAKIGTSSIKRLMQFDIPCLSGWLTKSFAASLSLAARFDYSARRAEELVVLDQDRALLVERSAHAG